MRKFPEKRAKKIWKRGRKDNTAENKFRRPNIWKGNTNTIYKGRNHQETNSRKCPTSKRCKFPDRKDPLSTQHGGRNVRTLEAKKTSYKCQERKNRWHTNEQVSEKLHNLTADTKMQWNPILQYSEGKLNVQLRSLCPAKLLTNGSQKERSKIFQTGKL